MDVARRLRDGAGADRDPHEPIRAAVVTGLEALKTGGLVRESGMTRREFLRGASAAAAAVASGLALSATPRKKKHHWIMAIDLRRCVGCRACVAACKAENQTPPGVDYNVVMNVPHRGSTDDKPYFLTRPCMQCQRSSCTQVCPTGATYHREQDNIVVIDYDRCIGCRYCIAACPYGARQFDFGEHYETAPETPGTVISPEYREYRARTAGTSPIGNVRKCTFCVHLQDENGEYNKAEGRWPACAKTCTGHAIHFGDFMNPNDAIHALLESRGHFRLKEELGNDPSVYYLW
jgi:Fe-S-cluster-containing dehydrogenase component